MTKALTDLRIHEEGRIATLQGGWKQQAHLRAMGLVEGQLVRKLSVLAWGGPVIVLVNRAQIAIGRGMARRIIVKVNRKENDEQN